MPLLLIDGNLQRVHIECVACDRCDQRIRIANLAEPSLYFGVPNWLEAENNALKIFRVACPHCGASLPRVAIWAELDKGVVDNG